MKTIRFLRSGVIIFCSLALAPCIYAAADNPHESGEYNCSDKLVLGGEAGKVDPPPAMSQARQQDLQSTDKLIGQSIRNTTGQTLGKISDVIIDTHDGQVAYVVVAPGGALGTGAPEHVVPFKALTPGPGAQFTLNMSTERFATAPQRPQNLADRQFNREVFNFYGVAPYWQEEEMQQQLRQMHMEEKK